MIAPSFGSANKNSFRSFFGQKSFSKVLILLFSTKKNDFQSSDFRKKQKPLYEDFFDDLGID